MRSLLGRQPVKRRPQEGFTLIELLVVLVVLPLIIGAIAEALIVSFNTESGNSNRLSDTLSAQLAQEYFVRDVQGASLITTVDNSTNPVFSLNSPKVCTPGTTGTPAPTLLVALFHPTTAPTSASPTGVDISYWMEPTGLSNQPVEIDRYQCALNSSGTYTSTPSKTVIANGPPGNSLTQGVETLVSTGEIQPYQFDSAAQFGWVPLAAYTNAATNGTLSSLSTLPVGTTVGFSVGSTTACAPSPSQLVSPAGCSGGTFTVGTTQGLQQVTCTGFDMTVSPEQLTGCSGGGSGYVTDSSLITQSKVSAVQLSVTAPASSYHFSLLGAPRPAKSAFPTISPSPPNLLTLGAAGINPGNGGGHGSCPSDSTGNATANICIGTANGPGVVVVDSSGTVVCNGGGGHTYIHFQNNNGTVESVAPASSSSCNTVNVVNNSSGAPDPFQGQLPNNGCMPTSFVSNLPANPSTDAAGNAVPGVYTTQLSGTLEPGVYVVEGGLGTVTSAAYSASDPYFYPYSSSPYYSRTSGTQDPTAGALLFIPASNINQYSPEQGCYTYTPAAVSIGGVQGILPIDHTQASSYFGTYTALGDLHTWLWQDQTNTADLKIPTNTNPYTGGNEEEVLYAPGATLAFNGNGTFATGAAIVGGVTWGGTDTLCLNWPSYSAAC